MLQEETGEKIEFYNYANEYCRFEDKEMRLGFIKKVYAIIAFQFLLTTGLCLMPMLSVTVADWMTYQGIWLAYTTLVVSFVLICAMACSPKLSRKVPLNYVLLTTFTLLFGYFVACICAFYAPEIVATAAGMTAAIVVGLTLFAFSGLADFTVLWGALVVLLMASLSLMLVSLITGFYTYYGWCFLFVFIYGMYLVIDTKIIMGGKRYKLLVDDYILCAMILYLDMIMIFLYILALLGGGSR
eukprot:CAMPEP_0202971086 /NCGR_PEP_ID=MMETSP1396-20130829/23293_1 /ASSEMBLY_ACC=CAM_ASM_000872 /TAXON_ID= /ORGANISM="Pseudokeronopsis sp., Strain Brazil" /LENGTH=241 /DNA_ID=CAMNT_0049700097 /DNA_START=83 /DNA_END=808 /DNA_ORIENTATION=+